MDGRDGRFARLDELLITQPAQEKGGVAATGAPLPIPTDRAGVSELNLQPGVRRAIRDAPGTDAVDIIILPVGCAHIHIPPGLTAAGANRPRRFDAAGGQWIRITEKGGQGHN